MAELLEDFRLLQYYITAVPVDPVNFEDYFTEGWAALRQCAIDGHHIVYCAADCTVTQGTDGEAEQDKAELQR